MWNSSVHDSQHVPARPERPGWTTAVLLAGLACAGCGDRAGWPREPNQGTSATSDTTNASASTPASADRAPLLPPASTAQNSSTGYARPVVVQHVAFVVHRFRATQGVFSGSGKIWNTIDEEAIPADQRLVLQRNGLRVGRGHERGWPQIKALLEADEVEVFQNQRVLHNGLPLFIELEHPPAELTLFMYRLDGTMPGATFPQSVGVIRIEYGISTQLPDTVIVEVMPEIRMDVVHSGPRLAEQGWLTEPSYVPSRPLRELAVRTALGTGEFLAVGPTASARSGHLAGSLLMCEQIDGRALESLFIIVPKIQSAGQAQEARSEKR